jgi:WD40 repeat protein
VDCPSAIQQIAPNPTNNDVVAARFWDGHVEIFNSILGERLTRFEVENVSACKGNCSEKGTLLSCSLTGSTTIVGWSPKGKQIACGDDQGNVSCVTVDGQTKSCFSRPDFISDDRAGTRAVLSDLDKLRADVQFRQSTL